MKTIYILLAAWGLTAGILPASTSNAQGSAPVPVLVELFTSEGCSSCPPADSLLQELDHAQAVPGPVIVLSEHVDYWNHDGWKDPYSSGFFSNRQNSYASHLRLASVYTPQMIVDGATQFVGNDRRLAVAAIEESRSMVKVPVRLSNVTRDGPDTLRAHIEADSVPGLPLKNPEVFLVAALDHAESQVLHGENEGRRLTHVAVVLTVTKVGVLANGKNFSEDMQVKLVSQHDLSNLRVIAFVQEPGPGRVLGAAMQTLSK